MEFKVYEVNEKLEQIDGIVKAIGSGRTLCDMDKEIIGELLIEYGEVLSHAKVML